MGAKPAVIQTSYHFAKWAASWVSAAEADGTEAPSAASDVAGNSVSGGKYARFMPMPMARNVSAPSPPLADSRRMPESFLPPASTSFGHFTLTSADGAKPDTGAAAGTAVANDNCAHSDAGLPGTLSNVAARLPVGDTPARPRLPRPA